MVARPKIAMNYLLSEVADVTEHLLVALHVSTSKQARALINRS